MPDESERIVFLVSVRPSDGVSPVLLGTGTNVAGIDVRCRQKESENSGADLGVDENKDVLLGIGGNGTGKKRCVLFLIVFLESERETSQNIIWLVQICFRFL